MDFNDIMLLTFTFDKLPWLHLFILNLCKRFIYTINTHIFTYMLFRMTLKQILHHLRRYVTTHITPYTYPLYYDIQRSVQLGLTVYLI